MAVARLKNLKCTFWVHLIIQQFSSNGRIDVRTEGLKFILTMLESIDNRKSTKISKNGSLRITLDYQKKIVVSDMQYWWFKTIKIAYETLLSFIVSNKLMNRQMRCWLLKKTIMWSDFNCTLEYCLFTRMSHCCTNLFHHPTESSTVYNLSFTVLVGREM